MNNQSSTNSFYDTTIRMIFLLIIIVWCFLILTPFVSVILWSLILALALLPVHRFLSKKIGDRPKLASVIIVTTVLIVVIIPIFIMISSLVEEVASIKSKYITDPISIPLPNEK